MKWTVYSEEKPQMVGSYLVTHTTDSGRYYVDYDYWTVSDKFKYHPTDVVAWMPFPKPYSKDEPQIVKKYDTFCGVPMEEAVEIMQMYRRGELVHFKNYAPKNEPQADYDKGLKLFADILFDKEKNEQFLKECKAMGIEPQKGVQSYGNRATDREHKSNL